MLKAITQNGEKRTSCTKPFNLCSYLHSIYNFMGGFLGYPISSSLKKCSHDMETKNLGFKIFLCHKITNNNYHGLCIVPLFGNNCMYVYTCFLLTHQPAVTFT